MPRPRLELRNLAGYNTHALDRTDKGICRKRAVTLCMFLAIVLCVMSRGAPGYIGLYAVGRKNLGNLGVNYRSYGSYIPVYKIWNILCPSCILHRE
jgi:hypothetical protein